MLGKKKGGYDVQRTCRSCLCDSNEMHSLQKPNEVFEGWNPESIAQKTIGELMMECADVQFKCDDGLPQNVCHQCVSELRVAFVYRNKCKESDAKLRAFFLQNLSIAEVKLERSDQKTEFFAEEVNVDHPLEQHWLEDESQQPYVSGNDDNWPMSDNENCETNEATAEVVKYSSSRSDDKVLMNDDDEDLRIVARAKRVEGRWLCEICNKSLADPVTLKLHVRLHLGKKLKRCSVCDKGFAKQNHLLQHMRRHGPKTYRCRDCNGVFESKEARRQHRSENHVKMDTESEKIDRVVAEDSHGVKINTEAELEKLVNATKIENGKYVCSICERSFTEKQTLRLHLVIHNTAEMKRCEICGENFRMSDQFNNHMAWHKSSTTAEQTMETEKASHTQTPAETITVNSDSNAEEHTKVEDEAEVLASKAQTVDGRFKCEICERTLIDRKSLVLHIRLHTGKNLHRCEYCQRGFSKRSHLRRHVDAHEKKLDPEKAAAAKALRDRERAPSITSSAFEMLGQPNADKNCVCKICDATFNRIASLRKHIRSHGAADPLLLNTLSSEQYQITNSGGWELTLSDSETDADDSDCEDSELPILSHRIHTCGCCNRSYDRRYKLVAHMNFDHSASDFDSFRCTTCNQPYPNEEILGKHRRDQCENSLKIFACKKCGVRFQWANSLELHASQGHKRKKFSCDSCDRKYLRYQDLERHKKTHDAVRNSEENAFKYICAVCSKPFKLHGDYKRHRTVHNADEKKFTCDICQRKFARKDNMKKHMRTHDPNAAKPTAAVGYLCIYCGVSLTGSSSLTVHMRRHTGEKPFSCDLCDKTFARNSDKVRHTRTHTGVKPHACTLCGRTFSRSNKLARHMRVHAGERPFKCTFCDRDFTDSSDLKLHVRRHTGEKPYVCGVCGARFIQNSLLKQHRRIQGHSEEDFAERKLPHNSVNNLNARSVNESNFGQTPVQSASAMQVVVQDLGNGRLALKPST